MLAACWSVDVINGGFGFTDTGFFTTLDILSGELLIRSTISFASFSGSNGSDFFLSNAKLILLFILSIAFSDISQNSSGTNFWISLSLSTRTLNATDCTLPADKPLAIFFHNNGDSSKPTTLSRNLLACCALTKSKSMSLGSEKESIIASFVIWLNLTLENSYLFGPRASLRCHAIASPSLSKSVAR